MNAQKTVADAEAGVPAEGLKEAGEPAAHQTVVVPLKVRAATDALVRAACVTRMPTAVPPNGTAFVWICAPMTADPAAEAPEGEQAEAGTTPAVPETATARHRVAAGVHPTASTLGIVARMPVPSVEHATRAVPPGAVEATRPPVRGTATARLPVGAGAHRIVSTLEIVVRMPVPSVGRATPVALQGRGR